MKLSRLLATRLVQDIFLYLLFFLFNLRLNLPCELSSLPLPSLFTLLILFLHLWLCLSDHRKWNHAECNWIKGRRQFLTKFYKNATKTNINNKKISKWFLLEILMIKGRRFTMLFEWFVETLPRGFCTNNFKNKWRWTLNNTSKDRLFNGYTRLVASQT